MSNDGFGFKESAALANRLLRISKEAGEVEGSNCLNFEHTWEANMALASKGPTGKKGTLQTETNQAINVSVVSPTRVQELFAAMASQSHIPFRYPDDGCYARAHEMSRLLERHYGIITAKAFIEGDLRVQTANHPSGQVTWWYHVAPVVLVKKNGRNVPYIIDPSLFNRAVPLEEWYNIQTQHATARRDRLYFTNRFGYTPNDRLNNLSGYNDDHNYDDATTTMRQYLVEQRRRHGN
ncbi:MAG: protein-glutamine glutaminase family protein [Bdellovibrionota bacterium]